MRKEAAAASPSSADKGLVQKVERVKATLDLPADMSLVAAVREANRLLDFNAVGGLGAQVDKIVRALYE